MNERRKLWHVELDGGRRVIRQVLAWAMVVSAVLAAIGYVVPSHRLADEVAWHSSYDDNGPLPLFGIVLAGVLACVLRRRRFGAGMATGAVCTGVATLAIAAMVLDHFLAPVQYGAGQQTFVLGLIGLFFGGIALVVAEPVLYVLQRRALERDDPPPVQLPVARVV